MYAIITGASQGIGKSIAIHLAANGYNLALISRNEKKLKDLCSTLSEKVKVNYYVLDVSNIATTTIVFNQIFNDFKSSPFILVNNAGIGINHTSNIDINEFTKAISVNTIGAINIATIVANKMKEKNSGYILNIASNSSLDGYADSGGYCATKFGLLGFSISLSKELIKYGIKVTAICPSIIDTPMTEKYTLKSVYKIKKIDICYTLDYLLKLNDSVYIDYIRLQCSEVIKNEVESRRNIVGDLL